MEYRGAECVLRDGLDHATERDLVAAYPRQRTHQKAGNTIPPGTAIKIQSSDFASSDAHVRSRLCTGCPQHVSTDGYG